MIKEAVSLSREEHCRRENTSPVLFTVWGLQGNSFFSFFFLPQDEDFQKLKAFSRKFKFEGGEGEEGEGDITEAEFKILAQTTLEEITGMKKSRPTTPEQDLDEESGGDGERDGAGGVDTEVARLEAEEMRNIMDLGTGAAAPPGLGLGIAETVKKCLEKGELRTSIKCVEIYL